jgi:hypothetical protein
MKMGNNKDKIEHLKPIESDLDFQPIYQLGRHLSKEKDDFNMKSLSQIQEELIIEGIDAFGLVKNVRNFFLELANNILFNQLKFPSIVIDFVLFDPADTAGRRFYIAICSINNEIVNKYKDQVDKNIKGDYEGSRDEKRRPILTNPNIYSSPYFYKGPEERSEDTFKKFKRIDENNIEIHLGSFYKREDNPLPLYEQAKLIEEFFDLIQEELEIEKITGKETYEFNTSILIPLMRPAASYSGDDRNRLNGGGVFIYGETKNIGNDEGYNNHSNTAKNPSFGYLVKKVARLKYFFERRILETSHSFITFEKQKEIHNNLELNLFHHFGSNLRGLPDLISLSNFGADNLNDWQKNILLKTNDYLRNCIDNIYLVSNCYQEYILRKDSNKISYSSVGDIVDELKQIKLKFDDNANIDILFDESILDCSTSIMPKILGNIFEQFIYNALKEYDNSSIQTNNRIININLSKGVFINNEGNSISALDFTMFNNETRITQVVLNNAGLKPIKSKTSSGLGLYFLNFSLHILGALESSVTNRFYEISNTSNPVGVAISFKFQFTNNGK